MSFPRLGYATSIRNDARDLHIQLERLRRSLPKGGEATLGSGTSTIVMEDRATADGCVLLSPMDATAQTAAAYVSARALGQFTITHASGKSGGVFCYLVVPNG